MQHVNHTCCIFLLICVFHFCDTQRLRLQLFCKNMHHIFQMQKIWFSKPAFLLTRSLPLNICLPALNLESLEERDPFITGFKHFTLGECVVSWPVPSRARERENRINMPSAVAGALTYSRIRAGRQTFLSSSFYSTLDCPSDSMKNYSLWCRLCSKNDTYLL